MKDDILKMDPGTVSRDQLCALRDGAEALVTRMENYGVGELAARSRRVRQCVWNGQSWDERKWGEDAFPFEGATDMRVRLAETVVRGRVSEMSVALERATVSFGSDRKEVAKYLAELWRATLEGGFAPEWHSQMALLALHLVGGGRGCAGLWTGWEEQKEMRPQELSLEDLKQAYQAAGGNPEEVDMLRVDPASLGRLGKDLGFYRADSARHGRELAEAGTTTVYVPRTVRAKPSVRALSLGEDLFLDPGTRLGAGDDAEALHVAEWLSRSELEMRAADEGWSGKFMDELARRNGGNSASAVFPMWDYIDEQHVSRVEQAVEAGKFQVVRSFVKAMTSDGIPARFEVLWVPGFENAPLPAKLCETPWGGWPVLIFSNEVSGPGAMDGVGMPVKSVGIQTQMKLSADMMSDISMLQLPPVLMKGVGAAGGGAPIIEPLGVISIGPTEDVAFMKTPQAPLATFQWMGELRQMRDELFGLPNEKIAPETTEALRAERTSFWLRQASEAVRRVLMVAAAHAEGADAFPELADGAFPVRLRCDPRMWSNEYVEKVANVFRNVLMPMDRKGVMNLEGAVDAFVLQLMPEYPELVGESAAADAETIRDEERNLMLIRNGIRPEVPEGGSYDYAGRVDFYERMERANPEVFRDMGPDKQQLLKEHVEALRFQAQQQENAQIGRTGVRSEVGAIEAQ